MKPYIIFFMFFIFLAATFFVANYIGDSARNVNDKKIFASGVYAVRCGVPATANPEIYDGNRRIWLNGWCSARGETESDGPVPLTDEEFDNFKKELKDKIK